MYKHLKLGKTRLKVDTRTLKLADYIDPTLVLPTAPGWIDYTTKASKFGMMLNDSIGDCAIAGPSHMVQCFTSMNGMEVIVPDGDVLSAYSDVSGYDPRTGTGDNGCAMLDVMNYWRSTGIGGHKILGYVTVNKRSSAEVLAALWLFGGLCLGLALPATAQDQAVWDVVDSSLSGSSAPYSWGGHCVPIPKYDADHAVCITWGQRLAMTWDFFNTYCDEAYAVLTADWALPGKKAPSGFDIDALKSDLVLVTK